MKEKLIQRLREEATYDLNHQTIALLLEAAQVLAAPVQSIGTVYKSQSGDTCAGVIHDPAKVQDGDKIYAQRQWVDLPPEEIQNCYGGQIDDFARALLAKSKERNT